MIAAEAKGSFNSLTDRQIIDKLVALGIFRATHAEAIGALGVLARKGLGLSRRHKRSALFKRFLAAIRERTAPVPTSTNRVAPSAAIRSTDCAQRTGAVN